MGQLGPTPDVHNTVTFKKTEKNRAVLLAELNLDITKRPLFVTDAQLN